MANDKAKNVLEALLEGTDYAEVLTEQQRSKLTELINETVDARVVAKEQLLTEEFEKKEQVLKEEIETEKQKLLTEAEENEKVLVEQAEKYKSEVEEAAIRQVKEFKQLTESKLADTAEKYKSEIEALVYNEAKEYKQKKDVALVEEVKKFKDVMIEKVSDYLEAKLEDSIPSEILEAAAKLDVYEPLVKSIMESFSRNFIKLDDSSYQLIKESKEHISRLENDLQAEKKRNISLLKEKREVERNVKIEAITEGLTVDQRSRARKLLEGYDVDEIEGRWSKMRDIIIESEKKPEPKKSDTKKSETVQPLNESKKTETNKPVQEQTVVDMQMKKVLNEETTKKADKKPEVLNEGDNHVKNWASKVKPRYANG